MGNAKVALITGCSSGIGRATALALNARGLTVWATARNIKQLDELKAAGCHVVALDVTDHESVRSAVETIQSQHAAIDILINNAGYSQSGAVEAVTAEATRKQFETNVFGPIDLTRLVLPAMRAQSAGRIVNISSMGGRFTFPGAGLYHASKYALEALSDALRMEVAQFGIDVVLIEPGVIRTRFGDAATSAITDIEDPDGAYATFHASLASIMQRAYGQRANPFGATTAHAAEIIARAATTPHPRPRYVITLGARLLIAAKLLVPTRIMDAMLRRVFRLQ